MDIDYDLNCYTKSTGIYCVHYFLLDTCAKLFCTCHSCYFLAVLKLYICNKVSVFATIPTELRYLVLFYW